MSEKFTPSVGLRQTLLFFALILPLVIFYSRVVGAAAAFVWLLTWLSVHSPRTLVAGHKTAEVYLSSGCGFISESVLVEDQGKLWLARSKAVEGDVILAPKSVSPFTKVSSVIVPSLDTNSICRLAALIRSNVMQSFEKWPTGRREWLQSFVLGADSPVDSVTVGALRRLGLLHIVVLSGGHLAVIAGFFLVFLRLIPLILFSGRVITMRTWPIVWAATGLLSLPAVIGFSLAAGMSQSIQRALMMFIYFHIASLFWGQRSKWELFKFIWLVQCIIFPIHFYSMTTLLTWTGSLILHALVTSRFRKSLYYSFHQDFKIQLLFAGVSLLAFGQSGLLGIGANLLLAPIFSIFLVGDLLIGTFDTQSFLAATFVEAQMVLLDFVRQIAAYQLDHSFLMIKCPKILRLDTDLGKGIFTVLVLWLLRKLYQRDAYY